MMRLEQGDLVRARGVMTVLLRCLDADTPNRIIAALLRPVLARVRDFAGFGHDVFADDLERLGCGECLHRPALGPKVEAHRKIISDFTARLGTR